MLYHFFAAWVVMLGSARSADLILHITCTNCACITFNPARQLRSKRAFADHTERRAKFAKLFHLRSGASKPSKSGGELTAFQADRGMEKVKAESEANGPLVDHVDRYFMAPTGFSTLN